MTEEAAKPCFTSSKKVLVTGGTGFVGRAVIAAALAAGHRVRITSRQGVTASPAVECVETAPLGASTDWRNALAGVDCVVHLAARVHATGSAARDEAGFVAANRDATAGLAKAMVDLGIGQLIFVSTAAVYGPGRDTPYTETDDPAPVTAYARSKRQAEIALGEVASSSSLSITILRPPLIYGPGVRANFRSLMRLANLGIPLPLGSVANERSLLYVENLADLIVRLISLPLPGLSTYLVADDETVSTPELMRRMTGNSRRGIRLFPFPARLLRGIASIGGFGQQAAVLTGTFVVRSSLVTKETGWRPPFSLDQGLKATADWYQAQEGIGRHR